LKGGGGFRGLGVYAHSMRTKSNEVNRVIKMNAIDLLVLIQDVGYLAICLQSYFAQKYW
jgi:hypothetical protein